MSFLLMKEIEHLKKKIISLSTYVEENLQRAVKSLETRDAAMARKAIEADTLIDQMEIDVEEECLKILALHQPVAVDLRYLVATLKLNSDLERIGDLAVNIAERAACLAVVPKLNLPFDFSDMAKKVQVMLTKSLNALVDINAPLAREVLTMDDAVDAINREMYDRVNQDIQAHPEHFNLLIHFLSVSRNLERVADHATNIAEDVIYMIEGAIVRHHAEESRKAASECPPDQSK
ncbi:MAG: phosphate signaling complex protein PhoU [Candidatus Firestonebacteria bacterium]|nr:phosphate signaling complex protein PhoU [Candidatus Firestonebacteria bacterium]